MEKLIQRIGVKKVKVAIALIVVVALVLAPLAYFLPRAMASEENINVQTEKKYDAEAKAVAISMTAAPATDVNAVVTSVILPDKTEVQGNVATFSATANGKYEFIVKYSLTIPPQEEGGDPVVEEKQQVVSVEVNDFSVSEEEIAGKDTTQPEEDTTGKDTSSEVSEETQKEELKNQTQADTSIFTYKDLKDGTIAITGLKQPATDDTIIFPAMIDGKTVVSVGESFSVEFVNNIPYMRLANLGQAKNIIIEEGISYIGAGAFEQMKHIETVQLPSSIRIINAGAFRECIGLLSINLPEGLTEIRAQGLFSCTSLKELVLPSTLTTLRAESLAALFSLKPLVVPDAVDLSADLSVDLSKLSCFGLHDFYKIIVTSQERVNQVLALHHETENSFNVEYNGESYVAKSSNHANHTKDDLDCRFVVDAQAGSVYHKVTFHANSPDKFAGVQLNGTSTELVFSSAQDNTAFSEDKAPLVTVSPKYKFLFWSENSKATSASEAYDFTTPVTANIDLYAIFIEATQTYDVILDANGGKFDNNDTQRTKSVQQGEELALTESDNTLTKGTSIFDYWAKDPQGKEKVIFPFVPTGATVLYATYKQASFNVTIDAGEGTFADGSNQKEVSVESGKPLTKPETPTPPEGKEFDYWESNGKEYNFSDPVTGDITITAVYKDKEITVTLEANGGTLAQGTEKINKVVYGSAFTEPKNPKAPNGTVNMAFDYWTDKSDSNKNYNVDKFDFSTILKENKTLYATYAEDLNDNDIPDYRDTYHKVTLDENGGSFPIGAVKDVDVLTGTKMAQPTFKPTIPAVDGVNMTFAYWSTDSKAGQTNEEEKAKAFQFNQTNITKNETIYAIYAADENGNGIPDYKDTYHAVEFVANGGEFEQNVTTKFEVLTKTAVNPISIYKAPEGKAFDYWSLNKNVVEDYEKNQFDFTTKIEKDTNLYAIFADDKNNNGKPDYREDDHKVTFDMNGGPDKGFDVLVKVANAVTEPSVKPTAPAKMAFDYWSAKQKPEQGKDAYNFAAIVTSDITLYAIYAEDINENGVPDYRDTYFTVTLDANKGTFAENTVTEYKVLSGLAFAQPKVTMTAPEGKTFDYWSSNKEAIEGKDSYDFKTIVTKNTTLFAIFAEDKNDNDIPDYKEEKFIIKATSGANGIIAPEGDVSVLTGTAKTFIFASNIGYEVASIRVDGVLVRRANTYTFDDVTSNHTIHVTFRRIQTGGGGTVAPDPDDGGDTDDGNTDNGATPPPTEGTDTEFPPITITPDGTVDVGQITPERPGFEFAGFQNPEDEIIDGDIPLGDLSDLEEVWKEIPDEEVPLAQLPGHEGHNHILWIILLIVTTLIGGVLVYRERKKYLDEKEELEEAREA